MRDIPLTAAPQPDPAGTVWGVAKRLWGWWVRVAEAVATFVGRALLTGLYFTAALPFAVVLRLTSDPLDARRRRESPHWHVTDLGGSGLDEARKQG